MQLPLGFCRSILGVGIVVRGSPRPDRRDDCDGKSGTIPVLGHSERDTKTLPRNKHH